MKWWYWLVLELMIIFGVIAWIYFFPSEIEYDFAKGMIGFVLIYAITECKDTNRRKTMSENYTIEQNTGENQIESGVLSISGSVEKQYHPFNDCNELIEHYQRKYKSAVGCDIYFPSLYKPCIWVKSKVYKTEHLITGYDNDTKGLRYGSCVCTSIYEWIDMKELFDNFTFLDGSPVGKLEVGV